MRGRVGPRVGVEAPAEDDGVLEVAVEQLDASGEVPRLARADALLVAPASSQLGERSIGGALLVRVRRLDAIARVAARELRGAANHRAVVARVVERHEADHDGDVVARGRARGDRRRRRGVGRVSELHDLRPDELELAPAPADEHAVHVLVQHVLLVVVLACAASSDPVSPDERSPLVSAAYPARGRGGAAFPRNILDPGGAAAPRRI